MKRLSICVFLLVKMLLVENLISQSNILIDDFPDFFSTIVLDSSSVHDLIGETDSVSVSITDFGWVEINLPSKQATLICHYYDLNQVVRSFRFSPVWPHRLSNGLIVNQSTLAEVEQHFNKQSSNYGSTRIFMNGLVYHFSKVGSKELLTSIEIRNENGADFKKNFVVDSTRLMKFYNSLIKDIEWILKSPPENLVDAMKNVGLIDLDDYPQESIYRKLDDHIIQYQTQFPHHFLHVKANILYNPDIDSLIYFSLIFDDNFAYEYPVNKLLNDWQSTNTIDVVGFWCSIGGSPPKRMQRVLDIINQNNYRPFIDWMKSLNPEIRLYGAIGTMMYRFRHQNNMEEAAIHQANEILAENRLIYGCKGCSFGNYKQQEIAQLSNLYQIYSSFKETGWIR